MILSPGPVKVIIEPMELQPRFSLAPRLRVVHQAFRYARYNSPRAHSVFRERDLSPSPSLPCAFASPSGTRTRFGLDLSPDSLAVWTFHLRYS